MIYCRCSIHKHIVQNESTRGKTKIILLTLEMARQEVSRTTHIEEGELRVTHENAILTNITVTAVFVPNVVILCFHFLQLTMLNFFQMFKSVNDSNGTNITYDKYFSSSRLSKTTANLQRNDFFLVHFKTLKIWIKLKNSSMI